MQTDAQRLEAVEVALRRWHTRLTRASNAIRKLEAKRRRLNGTRPKPLDLDKSRKLAEGLERELKAGFEKAKAAPPSDDISWSEMTGADLTIPPELKRTEKPLPKAGDPGPKLLSDLLNKPLIDARKKKRLEKLDERRRGRSMFGKSDMPLTGKDALKAIKAKREA